MLYFGTWEAPTVKITNVVCVTNPFRLVAYSQGIVTEDSTTCLIWQFRLMLDALPD